MSSNLILLVGRGIFTVIAFDIATLETILSHEILIDVIHIVRGADAEWLHNWISNNILLIKETRIT
jgi:hypothetical protein